MLSSPHTPPPLSKSLPKVFVALFRICRLSTFGALSPLDRFRAILGNPPSSLLVKHMAIWSSEAPALCGLFAHDLLEHITGTVPSLTSCLSEDSETLSASDEEDLFSPLSLPPNFSMDPCPTDDTPFQPLNPAGQQLVGRYIYYKWPDVGWCLGQIKEWNSDPYLKMWRKTVNFRVYYECDQTTATHILNLNNYNTDIVTPAAGNSSAVVCNGLASDHSWILLAATP